MNVIKYTVLSILFVVSASTGFADRSEEITLVMVPREEKAVAVGMDVANRYPTLLISYKLGANDTVSLHGWNGSDWVNITSEAFASGAFFRKGPSSALLVEKSGEPMPESLVPSEEWCTSVYKITTTEPRPLLHLVGQYYNFDYKQWEWFAKNYKYSVDEINPEGLNIAWYHKPLKEHLSREQTVGTNDLQYWTVVRQPEPVPEAPVVAEVPENGDQLAVEETPEDEVAAESAAEADESTDEMDAMSGDTSEPEAVPAAESAAEADDDPLAATIPEAVIMGAGDAEEAPMDTPAENADEDELD